MDWNPPYWVNKSRILYVGSPVIPIARGIDSVAGLPCPTRKDQVATYLGRRNCSLCETVLLPFHFFPIIFIHPTNAHWTSTENSNPRGGFLSYRHLSWLKQPGGWIETTATKELLAILGALNRSDVRNEGLGEFDHGSWGHFNIQIQNVRNG